jgi:hypothetical protein
MADTVETTWIYPPNWDGHVREEDQTGTIFGNNKMIVNFKNLSDSTGESDIVKITREDLYSTQGNVCGKIRIDRIEFVTFGIGVQIEFDMNPHQMIALIPQNGAGCVKGPFIPKLAQDTEYAPGETGNVMFTTIAAAANDSYDITIYFTVKE